MKSFNFVTTALAIALPLATAATGVFAVGYLNDHQTLRAVANEPQEYLARNAVWQVGLGLRAQPGFPGTAFDIEKNPSAYLIFYDASGTPVAGSALLFGQPPTLPEGVFAEATRLGVNRITWQPAPEVRQAITVIPAGDGFVMAGRSLAYLESEMSLLKERTLMGWGATMVAILIVSLISSILLYRRETLAVTKA